jgi:topoisomerase-4 subunit A
LLDRPEILRDLIRRELSEDAETYGDARRSPVVARFGLTSRQAEAILELRLRHLARIEEIRIRAEQEALAAERKKLRELLDRPAILRDLIRRELTEDAETYGDARRSPVVARREAQAFARTELIAAEPVTVILSERGWVRAARGHEIDPAGLAYKAGDRFLAAARGRSTQAVLFLDGTGRSYSLPALELPSARGQGEPLSGRLNLPPGAEMIALLMGEPDGLLLLASNAGYGFIAKLEDLLGKNRAGKAVLTLPKGARPLYPLWISDPQSERIVAVTQAGRMLVFPAAELPRLARGKGNKLIHVAASDLSAGADELVRLALIPRDCQLTLHVGKRFLTLRPANIAEFEGPRGRRGRKLPRGLQKVERIEASPLAQMTLL